MKRLLAVCFIFSATVPLFAQKAKTRVWTQPDDPTLPADFNIQGEYTGTWGEDKLAAQVIALGGGRFQAVMYPRGLPGDGWRGRERSLLDGRKDGEKTVFETAKGAKKYLGKTADEFSATDPFPPEGQQEGKGEIADGRFAGELAGTAFALTRTVREGRTLGQRPPPGAKVLFDGSDKDAWQGGRLDEATKLLNTDGKDIRTTDRYSDYDMHLEFMLPFRPEARGQGRGNSGIYQVDDIEVQILDSFGLEGKDNECGGVYKRADPALNMCLPPLQWQTYDVMFRNAVVEDGKVVRPARLSLVHNGVTVHHHLAIDGKTGGARKAPFGTPGQLRLQGHGNPLQFRNIWIVER